MVHCTIQARTGSKRFPNKIMQELNDGRSVLQCMLERVGDSNRIDDVVVLTTENDADDTIADLCYQLQIECFRGSEHDVMDRMLGYIDTVYDPELTIVDLTSDCPLIDQRLIDRFVLEYQEGKYDYLSNTITRSYPDGFDVQVYSADALMLVNDHARTGQRSHTGFNIVDNSAFLQKTADHKIGNYPAPYDLRYPHWGLTVDEPEDLIVIQKIWEAMGSDDFSVREVVRYLEKHPEVLETNKHIERKVPGNG